MSDNTQRAERAGAAAWVYRFLPLAGVVFPALSLAGKDVPGWVIVFAFAFAFLALATWIYGEIASGVIDAVRARRNRRVTIENSNRIKQRLRALRNCLSDNHGNSPFNVGHRVSTSGPSAIRMSYAHIRSIECWRTQWSRKIEAEKRIETRDVEAMSSFMNECNFLGEECERVVREYVNSSEVDANDRAAVIREWDAAKDVFNGELQEWSRIFEDVNFTRAANCFTDHRPLKPIGS